MNANARDCKQRSTRVHSRLFAVLVAFISSAQETTIRTTVSLVVAPTTVTDRQGKYIDGLTQDDFLLYDDGKPQKIRADVYWLPISLVIAVQSSSISAAALDKIQKIGSMIEPLLIGERGEAAVVAYGDRVLKQRGLEEAVSRIGEELHSQYSLSFTPRAEQKAEFHQIRVEVRNRPELSARTRPGYWIAAPQ